jgi:hypothetical protein
VPVLLALLILLLGYDLGQRKAHLFLGVLRRQKRTLFRLFVVLLAVLLAYGWFVRPLVTESQGSSYGIAALQEQEGLEVDEGRNYAEHSVQWLTWYQGPAFVVLAFVGLVILTRREVFASAPRPGWLVVAILTVFSLLYLWQPSINPDQIWAMRRFLTVVVPVGAVACAVGIDSLIAAVNRRTDSRAVSFVSGSLLALVLIAPPMITSAPVVDIEEFSGLRSDFGEICREIGPDAYVLILNERLGKRLTQSFRSYCGVPAAWTTDLSDENLSGLREGVIGAGGELITVLPGSDGAVAYLEGPYEFLELTLSHPPQKLLVTRTSVITLGR